LGFLLFFRRGSPFLQNDADAAAAAAAADVAAAADDDYLTTANRRMFSGVR
jgi:hypothetical protein